MVIFHSYVSLPEGITTIFLWFSYDFPIKPPLFIGFHRVFPWFSIIKHPKKIPMVLVFAAFGFGGFVHLGLFLHLLETTSWNQLGEHGNGTCPMYLYNQSLIYIYIYCIPQYMYIYIYYIYTVLCIHNIYNRLIIYIYIYLYIYTHIWSIPPPCLTVLRLAQRDAVHGARDDLEILGFTRRFC